MNQAIYTSFMFYWVLFYFSFNPGHTVPNFKPIYCQSYKIGFVSNKVEEELLAAQEVFVIHSDKIEICPGLKGYEDISEKVASFLDNLKKKDIFNCLRGWRNETFDIRPALGQLPLFAISDRLIWLFELWNRHQCLCGKWRW